MNQDAQAVRESPSPRTLTGAGRKHLVEALLESFDRAGIERLTRFALDQDLEEISGGDNLRDCTFDLVEWSIDHGRLNDLVTGALAENPNSPALKTFAQDVWSKPQTFVVEETLVGPDDRDGTSARAPGSFWRTTPGMLAAIVGVVAVLGILFLGLRNLGILGDRSGAGSTPLVTISNASLRQVETDAFGEQLLNIAYDLVLTNSVGIPVRIEAVALDASSLRPARVSATAMPQELRAERADDRGIGEILVPIPFSGGCIVVRVAALDDDGDELSATTTPNFDPYNPANSSCPRASA